jgi:hypothetical protein
MEVKTAVYLSNNIKKGPVKVHPRTDYEGPEGSRCVALLFL